MIILTTLSITLVEYIAGLICLKVFKVRLWDYSETKFNIQGLICPFFTLIWGVMSAIYLLFIHSYILDSLVWLSHNLTFTFVIGFFYGVFTVDVVYSSHLIAKIKAYAQENEIVVKWEMLKADIRNKAEKLGEKTPFLFPMKFYRLIIKRRKEDKKISDFEKENKNEKIIGN